MKNIFQDLKRKDHKRYLGGLDLFKYIGPGLLVTVGFIDPGNWASNFAAGSEFGYSLLWVVTLSTIMLIVLQHNVAHLGIVTGLCLSEAATKYTPKWVSRPILGGAGFHFHFFGGNPGRCHCIGNVVGYSYYMGGCADNAFCLHYAFHQLLQKDRAFHYRIRLGDRAVVYL